MSIMSRALALGVAVSLFTACADAPSAPTSLHTAGSALAVRGAGGGGTGSGGGTGGSGGSGGGGGAQGGGTQLIITTPPTVNTSGLWAGQVIGPVPAGVARTVTINIVQGLTGFVSGSIANRTINGTLESVVGTVNGDTLALYIGNVCGACTLEPIYNATMSPDGTQLLGTLLVLAQTPFVATKQ